MTAGKSDFIFAIGLIAALLQFSVFATIGSAAGLVTIPFVVGESQEKAERQISRAGLVPRIVLQSSPSVPAGDVISQVPWAGTQISLKTVISLRVSTGMQPPSAPAPSKPAMLSVPFVVGQSQQKAEQDVDRAGLTAKIILQSSTVPEGQVISQKPGPGTRVEPGGSVDLIVSSGTNRIVVPNMVGRSRSLSETKLSLAGLGSSITETSSDSVDAGMVISQNPAAGIRVQAESIVDLVVSTGPVLKAVPNLVGLPEESASFSLGKSGLVVGTLRNEHDDAVQAGHVILQNPAAGKKVAPDSRVDLVISEGPAPADSETRAATPPRRSEAVSINVENKPLMEVLKQIEKDSGIRFKIPEILGEEPVTVNIHAPNWNQAIARLLKGFSVLQVSDENENLVAVWIMTSKDLGSVSRGGLARQKLDRTSKRTPARRGINPESLERMKKKLKLGRSLSPTFYAKLKDLVAWPPGTSIPSGMFDDPEMKDFFDVNGIKSAGDLSQSKKVDLVKKAARRQVLTMEKRARAQKVDLN